MFCSGKFPLCPYGWGSFPLSRLFDSAYLVLYGGPWIIWVELCTGGNKKRSICILLHAGSQLSQHHLLKMVYFSPLDGFGFSVKDQVTIGVTIGMWVYFRVFNSSPLICLSLYQSCGFNYYCSVVHLEVRDGDSTRSSFIVENSFHYPGILLFQWSWELLFLSLWRIELEVWWGLQWICRLLLVRCPFFLCQLCPFMSVREISIFWGLPQFLSPETWSFCHTDLSPACLESHRGILYHLWLLWRVSFPKFLLQPVYPLSRGRLLIC